MASSAISAATNARAHACVSSMTQTVCHCSQTWLISGGTVQAVFQMTCTRGRKKERFDETVRETDLVGGGRTACRVDRAVVAERRPGTRGDGWNSEWPRPMRFQQSPAWCNRRALQWDESGD